MKCLFRMLISVLGCSFLGTSLVFSSEKDAVVKVDKKVLRIGFFPNLTHSQALVAQAMTHQGNGWLERYLPKDVKIEWRRFNAGPSAMENLIAGVVDISYVGPSPALNLYNRTKGKDCRLLVGAAKGGAGLVLQRDFEVKNENSWKNKRIATPQYGNTQDIACRAWFKNRNIKDVAFLPTSNPDQLALFKRHQIDGVWTIEPWLSRLVNEAGGKVYLSDDDNWTTILVGSAKFCEDFGALKTVLIQAHKDLSLWIKGHVEEAAKLIQSELKNQTALDFSLNMIRNTLQRIHIATEVEPATLQKWVDDACAVGFLKRENVVPLTGFMQEVPKETITKVPGKAESPAVVSEKSEKSVEDVAKPAENIIGKVELTVGKDAKAYNR